MNKYNTFLINLNTNNKLNYLNNIQIISLYLQNINLYVQYTLYCMNIKNINSCIHNKQKNNYNKI